jgi:hypothetical protein
VVGSWKFRLLKNSIHIAILRAGDNLTFADLVLAPFAVRLYVLEENRGLTRGLLSSEFNAWRDRVLKHPSVVNTMSDREHMDKIYGRYLRDEAQSEMAKNTRTGTVSFLKGNMQYDISIFLGGALNQIRPTQRENQRKAPEHVITNCIRQIEMELLKTRTESNSG